MYRISILLVSLVMAGTAFLTLANATSHGANAEADDDDAPALGMAGVLSSGNRGKIPQLTLSAGMPLLDGEGSIRLKSGVYYELEISADGSQELQLTAPGFFRAIWIDEVVIDGIEVRPLGLDSLEFDEAGTAEISFLAIKPGTYTLGVPGSDLQRVELIIE
ncbi:MAG: hypothetical protein H6888_03820 [Nitratireductor sp.]|nr:hypothetical protein [Nitratireductor sp.]MCC0020185.1 hypothetical protein [Nitratireductor sp.]